jgi:hypothetical protein
MGAHPPDRAAPDLRVDGEWYNKTSDTQQATIVIVFYPGTLCAVCAACAVVCCQWASGYEWTLESSWLQVRFPTITFYPVTLAGCSFQTLWPSGQWRDIG